MLTRRSLVKGATLAAPYFYLAKIVKADELNDGLVNSIKVVTDNLSLRPAGKQREVAGGGTEFGRAIAAQANMMSGNFAKINEQHTFTREVCRSATGYSFSRFNAMDNNFCCPLGVTGRYSTEVGYSGAMTLLEGPNFVGLHIVTNLLSQKGYTSDQLSDFVWPLQPCSREVSRRERALIKWESITSQVVSGSRIYANRDVLYAKKSVCSLVYTHGSDGKPDGGGRGAIIVNGATEFEYEFKYNLDMLRA